MENAAALLGWTEALLWQGFLVFLRVGPMVSLMPGFGEQSVSVRVKLGLAFAFTLVLAPIIGPIDPSGTIAMPSVIRYVVTETLNGLLLGIGVRLFVLALQTAGSMAAQATSLAQIFGGAGAEPLPAIGHVLMVAGLALAMMMGLHVRVVQLLALSYDMLPAGYFPVPSVVSQWGIGQVSRAFSLAFTLAAPFIIISVLYNLTLGVINRAMPQLMVAFVGAPVITGGALALLLIISPVILQVWVEALNLFIANPFKAAP